MQKDFKITVVGAGAMGSLFGGHMSLARYDVTLVDTFQAHVDAINKNGLRIKDAISGNIKVAHPFSTSNPSYLLEQDLIIIFTKAFQTRAAIESIKHAIIPGKTGVLSLQNGLGNE
ncbi:unnamed protein product, partial [marine sediment metagenome]